MPPRIDLKGQRFGRLEVVRPGRIHKRRTTWVCRCDCGAEKEVVTDSLRTGNTQSCGCLHRENVSGPHLERRLPPGEAAFNALFHSYRSGAAQRELVFSLSQEEFLSLVSCVCYYCGREPSQIKRAGDSTFVYNGIDRLDNALGYVKSNCRSCCVDCNYAKGTRSLTEFEKWIGDLSKKRLNDLGVGVFYLDREADISGVSGTGVVAVGIYGPSGQAVVQWVTPLSSVEVCKDLQTVEAIHGHGGATKVVIGVPPVKEIP
jgi:hypothetical protein